MVDLHFSDVDLARLYDVLYSRGSSRRDFDFYLQLIMAAGSVLDVGCGTGALLQQARRLGHRGSLCGLDPAIGMIEVARRHPDIEWLLGDLACAHSIRAPLLRSWPRRGSRSKGNSETGTGRP